MFFLISKNTSHTYFQGPIENETLLFQIAFLLTINLWEVSCSFLFPKTHLTHISKVLLKMKHFYFKLIFC